MVSLIKITILIKIKHEILLFKISRNLKTGNLVHTLTGHSNVVWSIISLNNGNTLVSCSWDKSIRFWNTQTGDLLDTFKGHTDYVIGLALLANGDLVI